MIIKKAGYFLLIAMILGGCKAKKAVAEGEADPSLSTKKIIQNHYSNALDFETLSGRVKIGYNDGDKEQGITVSLRMKKDEAIWVSAPLGLFKAYITPDRVSFYNKLEGEFFDGDFDYLTDFLGTEMDFEKVENVLIGNAVLDLRQEKYVSFTDNGGYALQPKVQRELYKIIFALEPKFFRARTQQLSQPEKDRFVRMDYAYQNVDGKIMPSTVNIQATNEDTRRNIQLDFKNIEFDRSLNFPYKIPKGFKSIVSR